MRKLIALIGVALFVGLAASLFPIYVISASETLFWQGSVSSDGTAVTTPPLLLGVNYRIEILPGIMYLGGPNYARADAAYYANDPADGWVWPSGTQPDSHSFLQINDQDVAWGPFSNGQPGYPPYLGHNYEILYVGEGTSIYFSIHDWIDGDYTDNFCHLDIRIYCSGGAGFTPGFWKHNIQVALGLSNGAYSSFIEDGSKVTFDQLVDWVTAAGYDLNSALDALSARGHGSVITRTECANAINAAAGFGPFIDTD